jgi:anti-sigma B factor antagonist
MTEFGLLVNQDGGDASVVVSGELDMYTAPQLRQELVSLVAHGARQVTVDLEGVGFVDSTALGVLVGGLKRLRQIDGDLTLRGPSARIVRVLEMTGLTKVFTVTANGNGGATPPA